MIPGRPFPARRAGLALSGAALGCALLVCLSLMGCGDGPVKQITETRRVEPPEAPAPSGQSSAEAARSSAERFGLQHTAGTAPAHGRAKPYTWEKPEAWREVESTMMRVANFAIGPQGEAQCYLTILSGDGGGVASNVNRWRGQMGLEALTDEQIAELPTIPMLGKQAVFVQAGGTFGGMGDDAHVAAGQQKRDYVLQGAILLAEGHALFVKMVGPEAAVRPEKDHFLAFCRSLRPSSQ